MGAKRGKQLLNASFKMEEIKKHQYLCHRKQYYRCLLEDTTPSLLDREDRERQDGSETAKDETS